MAKDSAKACSGFALAIDIISCILTLFIIGFFGYTTSDWVSVGTVDGNFVTVQVDYDQPWYVNLGIAVGVIDFLLTLTTSVLGCITLGGQGTSRGMRIAKVILDVLAWILMLVAAACATATAPASLSQFTDQCGDGWSVFCSFGVAVALSWAVFGLLFIASILHIVSGIQAKPAAGDVEAAA